MQLSTIIGKQILSPSGELLGYVKNAYLSRTLLKPAVFACIDDDEEEFYLNVNNILSIGDVIIAQKSRISLPAGLVACPVGKTAYSHLGQELGIVGDYLFGEGTESVFLLIRDGVQTPQPANRLSVGEKVIVYPDETMRKPSTTTKKAASAKASPRSTAPKKPAPAPVQSKAQPPEQEPKKQPEVPQSEPQPAPVPQEAPPAPPAVNRFNLLGKQVKRAVYNNQGYPIALTGEIITPELLNKARRSNRLLELTVNTLTNIW
ncbi:MAG: hypothetical protein K2L87_05250 [Clostridiales bacterium]|nr:hypothetical protein [Clostridiales bacterium]